MTSKNPPWWPTADDKLHADAGCAHPDECRVASDPSDTGAPLLEILAGLAPDETREGSTVEVIDSRGQRTTVTFGPVVAPDESAAALPWTLSDLDAAHAAVGLGPEWLHSDRRREIEQAVTIPGEVVATRVTPPDAPEQPRG